MKKSVLFLFAAFCLILVNAQKENAKEITPDISSVVIYTEGVEVSHLIDFQLSEGRNLIVFQGLSPRLDSRSMRVNVDVGISVLSVSHSIDYLTEQTEKPRIRMVRDSLKIITSSITLYRNELDALGIQRDLLLKNQAVGNAETGTTVAELQKTADFFQTRIFEINKRVSKIQSELEELNKIASKLNSELQQLNAGLNYQRSEITVLLSAEKPMKGKIDLRYYIADAGWAPFYEIRAEDIDKPLTLNYRAKVFNNTDIDWVNIPIMLSTADPNKSVNYPGITPWKLNFTTSAGSIAANNPYQASNLNDNYFIQQQEQSKYVQKKGEVSFVPISVSELSIDLPLDMKYSVPSNAKPYIVEVSEYEIPATYRHICVPKMEKSVYLMAQIVDWEDLNLVEGEANVYFAETYVGKSYIYTNEVSDTLNLSLGRDKKVIVTRSKVKDFTSKQFIGGKTKETFRYKYEVKNNRKAPVNIEIIDQLPVSENSEIEVFADEVSGAEYFVLTGMLHWRYVLVPEEKKSFEMQYSVRYPRNKQVQTKMSKQRTLNAPSF